MKQEKDWSWIKAKVQEGDLKGAMPSTDRLAMTLEQKVRLHRLAILQVKRQTLNEDRRQRKQHEACR